jgi:pilin isopeptide linkage protein
MEILIKYNGVSPVSDSAAAIPCDSAKLDDNRGASSGIVFKNTYAAPVYTVDLTAQKKVTINGVDTPPVAGAYVFTLSDGNGTVYTAKNDANGLVTFPAVKVDGKEGAKSNFTITENADDVASGWTYDSSKFTSVVEVCGCEEGLNFTVSHYLEGELIEEEMPTFVNKYQTSPATLTLTAQKTVSGDGAKLQKDQFEFTIYDKNGKALHTVKNEADGSITFPTLSFQGAGIYRFQVRETGKAQEGWTLDPSIYDIVIDVTDDGKGHMIAKLQS